MSAYTPTMKAAVTRSIENSLLEQAILRKSHARSLGLVVALTAPHRGAGTSFLARVLAERLGADNGGNVALLSTGALMRCSNMIVSAANNNAALYEAQVGQMEWNDGFRARQRVLESLRARYQYIVLDCPSISESTEVLSIAPLADGMVIVVEAEKTERRQVAVLEQTLKAANGTLMGHVLNKRTYAIPSWLYRQLSGMGL